jgi:hypothetical protein
MVVKMFIAVFWVVILCSLVSGYQCFRGMLVTTYKTNGITLQKTTISITRLHTQTFKPRQNIFSAPHSVSARPWVVCRYVSAVLNTYIYIYIYIHTVNPLSPLYTDTFTLHPQKPQNTNSLCNFKRNPW